MANEEDEVFDIVLNPIFESNDVVSINQEYGNINITLNKASSLLEFVNGTLSNWEQLDRRNWSATANGWSGNTECLFDGYTWGDNVTFVEIDNSIGEIIIDLGQEKNITGFWAYYKYTYMSGGYAYFAPINTELSVSMDQQQWSSLGTVETPTSAEENHYINFVVPVKTRYIKYAGTVDSNLARITMLEMKFYGEKEQ